ncbi:MAG: hypothetical protein V3T53_14260 [Phycisphaerales bacterium]
MKRRLFKLVVLLLLGAIVNVAVAWGCAAWIDIDHRRNETSWGIDFRDGKDWSLSTTRSHGAMWIQSNWSFDLDPMFNRPGLRPSSATSLIKMRLVFVHPTDQQQLELSDLTRTLTAYGWPKLALWSGYQRRQEVGTVRTSASWTITTGLRITGEQFALNPGSAVPRTLPYRIIWPGFAINTIFYAVLLWMLWLLTLGPFTARRIIRRKRGHCIKCGYDLRGTEHEACPECGVEV